MMTVNALEKMASAVRSRRAAMRLKQHELADKAGVSVSTVQAMESTGRCHLSSALMIFDALNIEISIKS